MIRTKASLKQVQAESSFQLITFDKSSRVKLPKTKPPVASKQNAEDDSDSEFERIFGDGPSKSKKKKKKDDVTFDSARREIINFGIAGSATSDKTELSQQLLIKLEARKPKNPARNYKEILEEKRKQKEIDKTVNKRTLFGTSASLQFRSQQKKKKNTGLLGRYGKVEKKDRPENTTGAKRKR